MLRMCVCVCHRGGPWPQPCLSLSQINSNCGLQLFVAALPDVWLFSVEVVEQNRAFLMQMEGRVKRMSTWLAEVWEGSLSHLASPEWLFNASKHNQNTGSVPNLVSFLCRQCFRHHRHTPESKGSSKRVRCILLAKFEADWRQIQKAIPYYNALIYIYISNILYM